MERIEPPVALLGEQEHRLGSMITWPSTITRSSRRGLPLPRVIGMCP
jgi:hypothetical protein